MEGRRKGAAGGRKGSANKKTHERSYLLEEAEKEQLT